MAFTALPDTMAERGSNSLRRAQQDYESLRNSEFERRSRLAAMEQSAVPAFVGLPEADGAMDVAPAAAVAPQPPVAPTFPPQQQPLPKGRAESAAGAGRGFYNPSPDVNTKDPGGVRPVENQSLAESARLSRVGLQAVVEPSPWFNKRDMEQADSRQRAAEAIRFAYLKKLNPPSDKYEPAPVVNSRLPGPVEPRGGAPRGPVSTGTLQGDAAPRSVRNNNPGNLIYNDYTRGLGATGRDADGFAVFPSQEAGHAAMQANLRNYGTKGVNTVAAIINRWSPAAGKGNTAESTNNYIKFVAQRVGVDPNQPLDMNSPEVLNALSQAMAAFEGGTKATSVAVAAAPQTTAPAVSSAPAVPTTSTGAVQVAQAGGGLPPGLGAQGAPGSAYPKEAWAGPTGPSRAQQWQVQELQRQLANIAEMVKYTAGGSSEQRTLLAAAEQARSNLREIAIQGATDAASRGDERALMQLAQEAGAWIRRGPNGGYVIGGNGAQTAPLNAVQAAQLLRAEISPTARATRNQQEAERLKGLQKLQDDVYLEHIKTQNSISLEDAKRVGAMYQDRAKAAADLQRLVTEAALKGNKLHITPPGPLGGPAYATDERGAIYILVPETTKDGITYPAQLKPLVTPQAATTAAPATAK